MQILITVFFLGLVPFTQAQSAEEKAEALIKLFNRELEPKGTPFPKVPGPKPDQRVCVVGAGPAGIHMALSLKDLKYKNVKIFEASGHLGGKTMDYAHQNMSYPLGAIYLATNYMKSVVPLFRKYAPTQFVKHVPLNVKETNLASDSGIAEPLFYIKSIIALTGIINPQMIITRLLDDARKYYEICHEMFGKYPGQLMPKPSKEVLHRIRGSIQEFFEREGLETLIPVSSARVLLNLYGSIKELGALYYMTSAYHYTPLIMGLTLLGADNFPYNVFVPKDTTYAKMFRAIVTKENLNVSYHSEVVNIQHSESGQVMLDVAEKGTSKINREACDFVVWTALATHLMKKYPGASKEEKDLLSSIYTTEGATSIIKKRNDVRAGPTVYYFKGEERRNNYGVLTEIYLEEFLNPGLFDNVTLEEWKYRNHKFKTSMVYQEGPTYQDDEIVRQELYHHFNGLGATDMDILALQTWEYFPRWSKEELEGKHWAVFDIQGKRNIWYAGSSVSFESVASVIEYNQLLLRQMK